MSTGGSQGGGGGGRVVWRNNNVPVMMMIRPVTFWNRNNNNDNKFRYPSILHWREPHLQRASCGSGSLRRHSTFLPSNNNNNKGDDDNNNNNSLPKEKNSTTTTNTISAKATSPLLFETQLLDVRRQFAEATSLYEANQQSASVTMAQLRERISDLEQEQSQPHFWDEVHSTRAATVHSQLSEATRLYNRLRNWEQWHGDAQAALEMLSDLTNHNNYDRSDASRTEREMLWTELQGSVHKLATDCAAAELEWLLSGPYDHAPARLTLTAGAGGTEANDWVADLVRMYQRYCDRSDNDYVCAVLDTSPGDLTGYKSVELLITGHPRPYGWWHGEKGAHRLVRLSPFNANNKRQTTFAGVDVAPELPQSSLLLLADVHIADSELEITTMRAGGKGGQNVNKVNSAVRIKHLPSGLQVKCTQERSQVINKEIAMNRLKAQLLAVAQEQRVQEIRDIRGDVIEASWGAQIRNYVLHPYKQIKDPRTGWETSHTQAFLDGELLDDCIGAYLRYKAAKERQETAEANINR